MFSLVIVLVSIALVAALALATVYYGAQFAQDGANKAAVSRALQEGNQVVGAMELYRTDHQGQLPTGTADEIKSTLISQEYLKAWPDTAWEPHNDYVVRTGMTEAQCQAVNRSYGIDTVPACSDPTFLGKSYCCMNP